jgi:C_GCAxxG_C_C family probable redox protein
MTSLPSPACGALTGALMVLGLQFGPQAGEGKEVIYAKSNHLLKSFQEQHGSIQCKQLIHFDISLPEELLAAREAQVFHKICPQLVRTAAIIVQSMLNSETNTNSTNQVEKA